MKPPHLAWSDYICLGIGGRLSHFGEILGMVTLIYNPFVFKSFHQEALANAPGVISAIREVFPHSVRLADVGCGSGAYAAEAMRKGLFVVACEYSSHGRRMARRQGVKCKVFDLQKWPPVRFDEAIDLSICFEVAEHLSPELGDKLVRFIANLSPVIIFSAAQSGQIGTGHINPQDPIYWRKKFLAEGCSFNDTLTESLIEGFIKHKVRSPWFFQNVMVFNQAKTLEAQERKS